MIKDEMSGDAEFEAFLKGEGALARQLQAIAQPSPAPALDAAILAHARAALSDPAPGAANDAAPAGKWAPPPSLSWRWRIPAGIAATLLVGVIARQSFESDRGDLAVSAPVAYEQAPMPAAEAPAPAPTAEMPIEARTPAPPPPRPEAQAEPPAPVPAAAAAPAPPQRPAGRLEKRASTSARANEAPAPVTGADPVAAPAPAPAVVAAPAPELEKPSPRMHHLERAETVTISGSNIRAATDTAPPAEARADKPAAGVNVQRAPKKAMRKPGKVAAQEGSLDELLKESHAALERNAAPLPPAAELLERVERLLDAGDRPAALELWELLRRAYPDYPVPDITREKLERAKP